jgi:hypothetical protein
VNAGKREDLTEKGQTMNAFTSCLDYWNRKVRTLTVFDLKLIQFGYMALILILAKLFPQITSLSIWWFVAVAVICLARPFYVLWIRADDAGPWKKAGAHH